MTKYTPFWHQTLVMIPLWLDNWLAGVIVGFPAILLPALDHEDSEIKVDHDSGTTIVAARGIGFLIFLFVISIIVAKRGRKSARVYSLVPQLLGWILGYYAKTKYHLMIMSILLGFAHAGCAVVSSIVIGENASPKYRGVFFISTSVAMTIGTLVVQVLGTYLFWRTVALIAFNLCLISFLTIFFSPETPYWLVMIGKYDEAKKIFLWLRGDDEQAQNEFKDLVNKYENEIPAKDVSLKTRLKNFVLILKKRQFTMPMFVGFLVYNVFEFSGRNVFTAYANNIVAAIINDSEKAYYVVMVFDSVSLLAIFASIPLTKIIKRRTLLFSSGIIALLLCFVFSVTLYLRTKDVMPDTLPWISIVVCLVYFTCVNVGISPIVFCSFGELVPIAYKATGIFLWGIYNIVISTAFAKIGPYIMIYLGLHGFFVLCSVIFALNLVLLYKYMPETKDMTLQDIERVWITSPKSELKDSSNLEKALVTHPSIICKRRSKCDITNS